MEKLIEFIVCPIDKSALIENNHFWKCTKCGAEFKVTNGIPNLIPEERITENESKKA